VILLVALIVLGPSRMPEAARTVGKVVGEIRKLSTGFQREIREAFEENDDKKSPRRTESAPLASAVADLDAGNDEPDAPAEAASANGDGDAKAGEPPAAISSDDVRNGDGARTGELAPEVGHALDQVVAPAPGPSLVDAAEPAAEATAEPAASPDGDGAGSERAAS
jgi:sec-independent protein translocase protein TatB